jgi:homoserine kinase type II
MMTLNLQRSSKLYIAKRAYEFMNWDELQEIWPLPEPWSLRPTLQGINNLTQIVETPAGNYILRTYDADRHLEHIGYELNLLRELAQTRLSFRIPAPVPTVSGELFAIFSGKIITMSPWLPGLPPQGESLEQAQAAGQALAELVKVLADIQIETTFEVVPFPLSGDFEAWGKIDASSAKSIMSQLPLTKEEQGQILALVERTQAATSSLYRILPVQIIHRDYDQSNILMEGNSVTGVLDFEFCGPDLRILDLAYALSQWPGELWNTGEEWSVIDTFAQGYLQRQKLMQSELDALPLTFRLRATSSLFFRLGRYQRGLETLKRMIERIREILDFEMWLQNHEAELMKHIQRWQP